MVYGREADGVLSMRSILFLGCIVWFAVYRVSVSYLELQIICMAHSRALKCAFAF